MKISIFKINQLGDCITFAPTLEALSKRIGIHNLVIYTSRIGSQIFSPWLPKTTFLIETAQTRNFRSSPRKLYEYFDFAYRHRTDASLLDFDQGTITHFIARVFGGKMRAGGKCPYLSPIQNSINFEQDDNQTETSAEWSWKIGSNFLQILGYEPFHEQGPSQPKLDHLVQAGGSTITSDIVIHPGASREYQRWPLEYFVYTAEALSKDYRVLWIQPDELQNMLPPKNVTVLKALNIRTLVSTIASTRLFIGNNSGPLNIAYALGTPSISIWGPSSLRWLPTWNKHLHLILRNTTLPCVPCDTAYMAQNFCKNKSNHLGCLKSINPDLVVEKTRTILNRPTRDSHSPTN